MHRRSNNPVLFCWVGRWHRISLGSLSASRWHFFLEVWSSMDRSAPPCCSFWQENHPCPAGQISPHSHCSRSSCCLCVAVIVRSQHFERWGSSSAALGKRWEETVWRWCRYPGSDKRVWAFNGFLKICFLWLVIFSWSKRKLKTGLEVLLLLVSPKQIGLYLLKEIYWTAWGFVSLIFLESCLRGY